MRELKMKSILFHAQSIKLQIQKSYTEFQEIYIPCIGFAHICTNMHIKQMCKSLVRSLAERFHAWLTPFQHAIIVIMWTKHTTACAFFPRLWILLKFVSPKGNHTVTQAQWKRKHTHTHKKKREIFTSIVFEMCRHSYSVFLFWQLITDKRFGTSQKPARHFSC